MKRLLVFAACMSMLAGISAQAVSDGQYDPSRQHCSGSADNTAPGTAEDGCYQAIMTISDGTGHEYVGAGIRQTADGDFANTLDVWVDPGLGTKLTWTLNQDGFSPAPAQSAGTVADPTTGVHVYFGADDNLDAGEHDSSPQVSNGPSDGGGIQFNIDPGGAAAWLAAVGGGDSSYLLSHPLPIADAGAGSCADGICEVVTSVQRIALQGGFNALHPSTPKHRDLADYTGKEWDPETCAGPSDTAADCADATHPGFTLRDWFNLEGTVLSEPGIQFFEDPDPQGSPAGGPYPLPALYFGPCGAIFGGGVMQLPPGPGINDAGQFVVATGC